MRLKRFPDGCNDRINIFLNFYRDCRRQESFIDNKLYSIDELRNLGVLEQVTFSTSSYGEKDYEAALLKSDVYFYAKITGSDAPQPINMPISDLIISRKREVEVRVGDKEYYQECEIIRNQTGDTLKLGHSFWISTPRGRKEQTITFKPSELLRYRTYDLEFILDCVSKGGFYINQYFCPLKLSEKELGDFDIIVQNEQLNILKKAVQALDLLGYSGDLNISKLSHEENRNLMWLITAFIDGESISGLREDLQPIHKMKIGDATFILYFKKLGQEGIYEICDFFKTSIDAYRTGPEGDRQPTSQFTILCAADIIEASNAAIETLLPSFQKIEKNTSIYVQANLFMLELIRAYDMSKDVRKDILRVAYDFAIWIQNAPDTELPQSVKRLNYLQIVKRERLFNVEERQELYAMLEDEFPEDAKTGAMLLLDDQLGAETHFSKLTKEQKIEFPKYPIWRFWKTSN